MQSVASRCRGNLIGGLRQMMVGLLLGLPIIAWPQAETTAPAASEVLEVYVREGCPHCADAKAYLRGFAAERPWLRVELRAVDQDAAARDALVRVTEDAGYWPPAVPTFVFGERVLVGFSDAARSGPELARLVDPALSAASPAASRAVDAGPFGSLSVPRLGLPLFTLAVGLLDGFNPCAMWVLLFLLSLLVHLHDRRRMALIAGVFVGVSGVAYYAFMAAWLNVFLAVGLTSTVRVALAVLALFIAGVNIKDFLAGPRGVSLSIPASARPGLYARMRRIVQARSLPLALTGVTTLAVMVNFIELLCTAGFPAMYTAILAEQNLGSAAYYGYLALYIVGYITDDSVMVGAAVVALSSRKLSESTGRWLKLLSAVVMLVLGAVMLLRPDWLF
jgi:glutaredoxin